MRNFWEKEAEDIENRWNEGGGQGRRKDTVAAKWGRMTECGGPQCAVTWSRRQVWEPSGFCIVFPMGEGKLTNVYQLR